MDLGAEVFRETFSASLEMGEQVLVALGLSAKVADATPRRFREHDETLLREQYLVYDDETALLQTARGARADLEKLFEADQSDSDSMEGVKAPKQS